MFVPVVALLGVFGLWISRLLMGDLARMLVSMMINVMLALLVTLLDVVYLLLSMQHILVLS